MRKSEDFYATCFLSHGHDVILFRNSALPPKIKTVYASKT